MPQSKTHGTLPAPEKRTDQPSSEIDDLLSHLTPETRSSIAKSAKDQKEKGNPFTSAFYIYEILKHIPEERLKELVSKGNSLAYEFYVKQLRTTERAISRPAILGDTKDSAVPKPAIPGATTSSAVSRPSMLDMTEEELDATLTGIKRSELKIDSQKGFQGAYIGTGCPNPYKPQEQKENGGALAGFIGGVVQHVGYNEQLARASSEQKHRYYETTRRGEQHKSQVRDVTGEYIHSSSAAPSQSNKKNPEVSTSTNAERSVGQPNPPRPTASQPQAPRHNAKPPKSFFHGLATVLRGSRKVPDYKRKRHINCVFLARKQKHGQEIFANY